ncbi:hypothetical protein [Shewanella dokdonensis]|uniref:Uncharacterized protein n=1 Tax=Shewanella dokdonensis TaxID=712036 RepID=A0ABX8DC03_9GAMM|nr:hypothetical protein [Shewanella dokdonensis]MCL1075274.1 hypothetical protein [Shewanella dokdonensis]QVK21995.1 hypothetical protein KHX94_10890 [Shewanella dokdonensis]
MAFMGQTLAYGAIASHIDMMSPEHEQALPNHSQQAAQIPLCCKVKTHCFSCHFTAITVGHKLTIDNLITSSDAIAMTVDARLFLLVFPNFRPPIFA